LGVPYVIEPNVGIEAMSWEEGKGPRFDGTKVQRPTGFPVVDRLNVSGPLWKAGLRAGDIVLAVNGKDAREQELFVDAHSGAHYTIRVRRGGEEREFQVALE
jgi:S1-C subfamily serine protease